MAHATAGWERAVAIAAAGISALVAVPAMVAVGLFLLLSGVALDGCDVDMDLGPTEAGVSARPDGAVVVHPGPCQSGMGFESVRVRAIDGTVVWQADGAVAAGDHPDAPPPPATLVIGEAPPGYADVVPLAAPLDPVATYTVELSVIGATAGSSIADGARRAGDADALYTALGQSATFRPADLDRTHVTYAGERLTPSTFATLPCNRNKEADA